MDISGLFNEGDFRCPGNFLIFSEGSLAQSKETAPSIPSAEKIRIEFAICREWGNVFQASESRRAMHELRMNQNVGVAVSMPLMDDGTSFPERELLSFIEGVSELIGPESQNRLREIWLDELACLDCMPGPSSSEWRQVTLSAFRRLAMRLTASHPWE